MPAVERKLRFMRPDEREIIESWKKKHKIVAEFCYVWTRWKHWETNPPIVAVWKGDVAGFHAVTFTKSGYMNSLEIFVLEEYRGFMLTWDLLNFSFVEAAKRGAGRLRFRAGKGGNGKQLWDTFGLVPIGECHKDWWYDLDLSQIKDFTGFRKVGRDAHKSVTTDKRTISYYRRAMTPLTKEYIELLAQ